MRLVEFVPPVPHPLWKLCLQMGITDVIVKVNPTLTGLADPWKLSTLTRIVTGLKSAGLNVVGLEGDPFDMAPIKEYGCHGQDVRGSSVRPREAAQATGATDVPSVGEDLTHGQDVRGPSVRPREDAQVTGATDVPSVGEDPTHGQDVRGPSEGMTHGQDVRGPSGPSGPREDAQATGATDVPSVAARETALARYRELLESMATLGIRLLCYNFMVGPGWSRTGVRPVRGGALATYFNQAEYAAAYARSLPDGTDPAALWLTKEQVWANYEYFLRSVMPTAERVGVRMGLHPDDPCLPSLGGFARIFETVADYDRAYAIYPSAANAVTYCQANFKLMGADLVATARHFGQRIAFIHVRDVEGDKTDFTELFHDQGTTDQFELMRTYRALGLDVPVRGDHVPEMEGDRQLVADAIPGYFNLGRLFANGYLKALLKGTEK